MTYADGTTAELALDDGRLMWRVTYRASSTAVYDAFVDARTGNVRRRVNLVKSDTPALGLGELPGRGQRRHGRRRRTSSRTAGSPPARRV